MLNASRAVQLGRDVRNVVQAQLAARFKRLYMPSLFGHYTVNSACNLRCSYCYVGQPEIFPEGFANQGLSLPRAQRVLATLRRECLFLRLQGGEPLLYPHITELARHARRDLRYWHVSVITNGLLLAEQPAKFDELLRHIDLLTLSVDATRRREYLARTERLEAFLPELRALCARRHVTLTANYTATWDELAEPARIRAALERYRGIFAHTYIMPVRQAGKTPLALLRNALELNREYSVHRSLGLRYPARENVGWYREHCDPKLKIKIDANGGLVYPCENHAYSAGSLETHGIRELWTSQASRYPNESCLGCGKQRFRSYAFKRPLRVLTASTALREWRAPAAELRPPTHVVRPLGSAAADGTP